MSTAQMCTLTLPASPDNPALTLIRNKCHGISGREPERFRRIIRSGFSQVRNGREGHGSGGATPASKQEISCRSCHRPDLRGRSAHRSPVAKQPRAAHGHREARQGHIGGWTSAWPSAGRSHDRGWGRRHSLGLLSGQCGRQRQQHRPGPRPLDRGRAGQKRTGLANTDIPGSDTSPDPGADFS
jgi:hypothetical protein